MSPLGRSAMIMLHHGAFGGATGVCRNRTFIAGVRILHSGRSLDVLSG